MSVIAYRLCCQEGHEFEAWFRDSGAFEAQVVARQLCCPDCGSLEVEKAIMAPAVAGTRKPAVSATDAQRMRQFATGLRKYVQDNAQYVGTAFPEEARKIHYGEAPKQHIYGEASLEEARDLVEEGIDVAPLPPDPEAAN